jgi:hypothetical protein
METVKKLKIERQRLKGEIILTPKPNNKATLSQILNPGEIKIDNKGK